MTTRKRGRPASGKTPVINLQIKGLSQKDGRFSKATGSHDPIINSDLLRMMTNLNETGKVELLLRLKKGSVTMLGLYDKWKEGDLSGALSTIKEAEAKAAQPPNPADALLEPKAIEWVNIYDGINDKTRKNYCHNFNQLLMQGDRRTATIADLPQLLRAYQKNCQSRKVPAGRQFNMTRNTVRGFLKNTIGRRSELYEMVTDIEPMDETVRREGRILMPAELLELIDKLPADIGASVWTLAITGMEIGTYLEGRYEALDDRVLIHCEKMKRRDNRRDRVVPLIFPIAPVATTDYYTYRYHIRKASGMTFQAYDLRRCYAVWLYHAGIPEQRIEKYMGHKPSSMTRRYANENPEAYLVPDAQRVRTWIDSEVAKVQREESHAA